jgi:hypothetical protein
MKHLILLIIIMMFVSCESNDPNTDIMVDDEMNDNNQAQTDVDTETTDESCILTTDLWESGGGGGEGCQYQHYDDFMKRYVSSGSGDEDGTSFVIDEIVVLEDRNEIVPIGECRKENKCSITFKNYDRSLFKDSLIGKEITVYWKEGFYGDVYGDYVSRDVQVVKHKDGSLIAVTGTNIVNEDDENDWDGKIWPTSLVPNITVEQEILPECNPFCVKYRSGASWQQEGDWQYDSLIAPPLKITVEGKEPVIVSNGEVVRSQGIEYFVRNSVRASEDDTDGYYFKYGKRYMFDFFIVNTEALR